MPSFACLPVSKQPIQLVQFFVSFSLRSGNDIFTRDAWKTWKVMTSSSESELVWHDACRPDDTCQKDLEPCWSCCLTRVGHLGFILFAAGMFFRGAWPDRGVPCCFILLCWLEVTQARMDKVWPFQFYSALWWFEGSTTPLFRPGCG